MLSLYCVGKVSFQIFAALTQMYAGKPLTQLVLLLKYLKWLSLRSHNSIYILCKHTTFSSCEDDNNNNGNTLALGVHYYYYYHLFHISKNLKL